QLSDARKCFEVTETPLSASESAARTELCGNTSCVGSTPIAVNTGPCPNIGATECTNIAGLGSAAVNAIRALQAACNCNIVISGGTEYWLHKTHAAGRPIFDLRAKQSTNADLNRFLLANGTGKRSSFANYRVFWGGFWWTREAENTSNDHWHACQLGEDYWFCTNVITKGGRIVNP
ncbi:MAG: hypothetical protein AAB869_04250, partial [Patescibacteria group bacterium]